MPEAITVLAFDFGTRRIGLAVGNSITASGQPLASILTKSDGSHFSAIASQIKAWNPTQLVVGLPLYPDGAEHAMTFKARRFGNQLHGRFGLPVCWVDERYTSAVLESDPLLRQQLDSESARLILEQYFQEQLSRHGEH